MGRGGEAVPQLLLTQIQPTSPHPHIPSPPPTGEKVHGPENKEQCPQGTGLPGRERTAQHVSDRSPETELHVHRPSLRKAVRCFLLPMKRNQMLCATLPKPSGGHPPGQRPSPAGRPSPTEPGTPLPSRPRTACLPAGRDGTGRDGTQPSLGSAALCPPRLALPCPALPSPALLFSPPLPSPGGLSEGRRCRCVASRAAAPGSSRDGAQPCGQRRSRRCRFQENGRLFPAEQVRRSGAERVTLSSLTPWQRGHGVSICHPFGCCWGGRAEDHTMARVGRDLAVHEAPTPLLLSGPPTSTFHSSPGCPGPHPARP